MKATEQKPDREAALRTLRGFQRTTVDHVVEQLFHEGSSRRFLVADEVGLGKTLVARGVVAEFIHRHWEGVKRLDIIYLCSNSALARENIHKLRVGGDDVGKVIEATRFTLMPTLRDQLHPRLNFISLTPGTALRTTGGGIKEERVILHQLLRERGQTGVWLSNFLQCGIRNTDGWRELAKGKAAFDRDLVQRFHAALEHDPDTLQRLAAMETAFARIDSNAAREASPEAYRLIGKLRNILARVCIDTVQPDLIILDEFQRFKDLLGTDDTDPSPEAELAHQLFSYRTPEKNRVALLLLSATPYRMFTTAQESTTNHAIDGEDHYRDFLQTLEFLVGDPRRFAELKVAIGTYRTELLSAASHGPHDIASARGRLQTLLLKVMCRRERVGSTEDRNGMVQETRRCVQTATGDVGKYLALEQLREHLDGNDLVELWKSAPYLLNFAKGYEFKRSFDAKAEDAPLRKAFATQTAAHLASDDIAAFTALEPGNGRLRLLVQETLDNDQWQMLWLAPSIPYWPLQGAWAKNPHFTKKLLFSSWNVVPDAVSALLSYEVERRSIGAADATDPIPYGDFYRRRSRLLRFSAPDGKAASMTTLALQLPCLRLAAIHPLDVSLAGREDIRGAMRRRIQPLLTPLRQRVRSDAVDPTWYWAAPLLLDEDTEAVRAFLDQLERDHASTHPNREADATTGGELSEDEPEHRTLFGLHVQRAREVVDERTELGELPPDLADVLADLALGSPAIAWARTLAGFRVNDAARRRLAARMGEAFRSLFNQPAVISMLQRDETSRYWRTTLRYATDGNLQAVLDEYAHLLWEPAAWEPKPADAIAAKVTEIAAAAITTKTSTVRPDYYRSTPEAIAPVAGGSALRTHFALRYGGARSGDGAQEVREDAVRDAFKSPFYPFILTSTSVGQEGLDFHPWCHSVWHWNLPGNPVDLEQREGRVHRYKGHAVRKNVADRHGSELFNTWTPGCDPWDLLFRIAERGRAVGESELVPCWLAPGEHRVERFVPMLALSREEAQLERLKRNLAIYRVVFGQPRQAELVEFLEGGSVSIEEMDSWVVRLVPEAQSSVDGSSRLTDASSANESTASPRSAVELRGVALV
jgi:hypothetical protein